MADLLSVLQANNQPPRGWASVGQALAGFSGAGREDAYNRGMAKAAQLDQLVQTARFSREKAMEAEDARKGRGGFAPAAIAAGIPEAQAGLLSSAFAAGYDPTKLSGYLGATQEQGFRGGAVERALAGDFGGGNAYLMGVANGPVELASVQGQNLINNRLLEGGGGISTTEQGRAGMAADAARAAASYASANSSNASAARTRQAMSLDRADTMGGGGGRSGMKAPSGYRWTSDGRLEAIPGGPADKGDAGGGKVTGDELKQAFAGKQMAEDAYDFAAAYLGKTPEAVRQMSAEDIRKQIKEGGRLTAGPVLGRLPGMSALANADLDAYTSSAAGRQARINNPTGPVTDADFKAAERSVFSSTKPSGVNADLVYRALMRGAGQQQNAAGQARPAEVRPTTGQAPAIGSTRGGYRYMGGNPSDRSSWEKL
ncbi:hypothetical protein [Stenotrophomonas sp.]|uniref:hypothetical protein n=1 Tax=Stenotrophomonas sp. TaxID=69392 RepID=UPI00289D609E|nr:hypothetical protein [Stenotrophomonas sp.]